MLNEARSIQVNTNRRIQYILSIGTSKVELKGFRDNTNKVIDTLKHIIIDINKAHIRFLNTVKYNSLNSRYFRFEVKHGLGIVKIDEYKKVYIIEDTME